MSGNQTNLPYIQSQSKDLNQVQQNTNRVFNGINGKIVALQASVNELGVLGEIRFSPLTLNQFQTETNTNWILANGQSCVGTSYASTYGLTTVPNISVSGTNAFIRVN